MLLDILIIVLLIGSLYRGREVGFVQQLFSTVGFFGGLLLGAWLEPHTVNWVHSTASRSLVTLPTTLGLAAVFLAVGEYVGVYLKQRVQTRRINKLDNVLGSLVSFISILVAVWLGATVLRNIPVPSIQSDVHNSRIVSALTTHLPPAPDIVADLGHLIDPNGFPQVFTGSEPKPGSYSLPSSSQLAKAVAKDGASVVKVEGQGCGGIVEGSGFVVGDDLVATNAHVVAGIKHPYVEDSNGTHSGTVIYFDPDLDFAVLQVSNLAGQPLVLTNRHVADNTAAGVLGFPGGGNFTAGTASVLDEFTADGRNIYGRGNTTRSVYEVAATIIPGNSGGPLVATDGSVIGVVFAESTTYNHVGYALTAGPVISAINQAAAGNQMAVSTGGCAE